MDQKKKKVFGHELSVFKIYVNSLFQIYFNPSNLNGNRLLLSFPEAAEATIQAQVQFSQSPEDSAVQRHDCKETGRTLEEVA